MHGARMAHAWRTHGARMAHAWRTHGARMAHAWHTHGARKPSGPIITVAVRGACRACTDLAEILQAFLKLSLLYLVSSIGRTILQFWIISCLGNPIYNLHCTCIQNAIYSHKKTGPLCHPVKGRYVELELIHLINVQIFN